ncbi:MAG: substrate-binding domain-containing protein, partial [Acetobacteraceae bacterium]|nr:substrate-binding domain-containing protein [Acetobacteraceae bacterium]
GKDVRLEGTVRLTTVDTLASEVLSPILAAFRANHPAVQVDIITATRSLSLAKREADVALRLVRFTQSNIVMRKVGEAAYSVYAARTYLERYGTPDWTRGAEGHFVILTDQDDLETPDIQWLRAVASRAQVALTSNSRLVHRAAARDGVGIACLARYMGDPVPGLVRLPMPEAAGAAPVRELWLGVHDDMRHTPRIRAFTAALQDGLKHAASLLNPRD